MSVVRNVLRRLLLPVPADCEDAATGSARGVMSEFGLSTREQGPWLELEDAKWRETGIPSPEFRAAVEQAISAAGDPLGHKLAAAYFVLHGQLTAQPRMRHETASALLSHARLIGELASVERLSAAQLARVVASRDRGIPITWQVTERILAALGMQPRLDKEQVIALFAQDAADELAAFADADLHAAVSQVSTLARTLGCSDAFEEALALLIPENGTVFGPYLQMLHFMCVVSEFFDHVLGAIYEFGPRGDAALWLFDRYPASLGVSGNPFLNNAKSVDALDRSWANGKKPGQRALAHSLVSIVEELDSLGHPARRELAAWIRRLLCRQIRLAAGLGVAMPDTLLAEDIAQLMHAVRTQESKTYGVLEQRLVDAVASLRHAPPAWVPRGVGDPVNATNVSRGKCGDCDFQNGSERTIVAYEAHAGKLGAVYLEGHVRTLRKALDRRLTELEKNFGKGPWRVDVTFVAHELEVGAEMTFAHGSAQVEVRGETYDAFLASVDPAAAATVAAFDSYVRAPLAERRTPDAVRASVKALLGTGATTA